MVMKRNMMRKNLARTISKSLGRYIALVSIIALGCALFVGLRITKTDMVATGQKYTDTQNMFDLRLLSTYGWTQKELDDIAAMEGIVDAEGAVTLDVFASVGEATKDSVYRLYSIPNVINQVYLLGGRMPQSPDECLADGSHMTDKILGTEITVSDTNSEDTLNSLNCRTYTVVGYISTPLYMDMNRGSTTLGSGSLTSYIYIPMEAFDVDYFTEIYVTIPGDWEIYTEEYTAAMDAMADRLELQVQPLAQNRYDSLKEEAEQSYADGLAEYENGLKEYEDGAAKAEEEFKSALEKLNEAQAELDKNLADLLDGETQIKDAQALLDENRDKLTQSRLELGSAKAEAYAKIAEANKQLVDSYKLVVESKEQVSEGLLQISDGLIQIEDGIEQIEDALPQLELVIGLTKLQVNTTKTALENAKRMGSDSLVTYYEGKLQEQTAQLEEYTTQKETAEETLAQLQTQKTELQDQKAELEATKITLEKSLDEINTGFLELDSSKAMADSEFAAASAKLESAQEELNAAQAELDAQKQTLEDGKTELAKGQEQLDEGKAEYEAEKAKVEAELADAKKKLDDAWSELQDARETIDDMAEPDLYVLTRNTNAGYLALDSSSDIVAGISKIFPAFFLLVAALVCITTMTRMIEEERTQIGTLKALGYGSWTIMNKYLLYSGSAAVIGCCLGVTVGSAIFPWILWNAYKIMLNITPGIQLVFDWKLSSAITLAYLTVSSLVTWYCCHRSLKEAPAELIRPKAPSTGKKIFLEYIPIWNRLSFLNKVMLRNVFRYHQRLLMMLVGIGGCTALLLTGFGIRDSIGDIVNIQFEEVTLYDIGVTFSEAQSEENRNLFKDTLKKQTDGICFAYQTSVELEYGDQVRDVNLLAGEDNIGEFMDFHTTEKPLGIPGQGEAFLTTGAAEALGIQVGDEVTVRTSDLKSLTVKISGICENYVYNFLILSPETILEQWEHMPDFQTAFVNVREGQDVYSVSGNISEMQGVINMTICQEQANQVNSMMDALNVVILTAIVCAGLLGATVLYNLTNINITERIREIATIKVLGFNAKETSAYVFKENIFLTVMGAGAGLIGGKFLLGFVMSQVKIDMIWFPTRATAVSFVLAIVLTLLTAMIVNFIFYFRLDKINMAEALKSVE